jgi:hypothetical protein
MWRVLLVSVGLAPIGFLGLAIYASALIARPISERKQRASILSSDVSTPQKSDPDDITRSVGSVGAD